MRAAIPVAFALAVLACGGPSPRLEVAGPAGTPEGYRLPGEFEPVDRVLIGFEEGNWDYLPYFTELAYEIAEQTARAAADVEEERRVFHVAITRSSVRTTVVAGRPAHCVCRDRPCRRQVGNRLAGAAGGRQVD